MNGNNTWRNWAILIALLVVFGLITALWSAVAPASSFSLGSLGGGNRVDIPSVPPVVEPVEFGIAALGIGPFEFHPLVAIGILAAVAIVGIAVVGAGIAFINLLISRQVTAVVDDESYKEKSAALEQRQKAEIKQLNEGRATSTPDHNRPGWSAVSTSLIVLFFVWMAALIINGTFYPEGQRITEAGEVVNTASSFIIPLMLIALLVLSYLMRPNRVAATKSGEAEASIPWDSIAVILLGLLVMGVGLAAMMFLL